jgi:hypothetical protein
VNLAEVMTEVAQRLDTIPGLRVSDHWVSDVVPPHAVIPGPEDYDYDATYGRGVDRMTLLVIVFAGRMAEKATRGVLGGYADGSGDASFKQVLETNNGSWSAFDSLRVTGVEFGVATVANQDYWAATFRLDVVGEGAT